MIPPHVLLLDLHELARLDVDEMQVHAEVAVEIDERPRHHVARADELADPRGGRIVHAPRGPELLLLEQALQFLALHHAGPRFAASSEMIIAAMPFCSASKFSLSWP